MFHILLSRIKYQEGDSLSIASARYLRKNRGWSASFKDLAPMARHPESLARGLAYTRLNPSEKRERDILVKSMSQESVESLKKLLASKLEGELFR